MPLINFQCPLCSSSGDFNVSKDFITENIRGITAVHVPEGAICSHSFIIYVDQSMGIRDSFEVDFQCETHELDSWSSEFGIEDQLIPRSDYININLILLNIPQILIAYLIK